MSVFHVTLMIWVVPWIASNTVLCTSTPASSESGTEELHFVKSHFDSVKEKSSDSDDFVVVSDNEESRDSEDFVVIRMGNGSDAEVDENTYGKERDLQPQLKNETVDPLSKLSIDVNKSGCIPEKQNEKDESAVSSGPSTAATEEAASNHLGNTASNQLGKKQIDDNGDLFEQNCTSEKEEEKKYLWAHAGISWYIERNNLFYSQSGKIPVCYITATHEEGIVRLSAECIVGYEEWTVKKIPMRNITEEAADVWTEPSARITDLIEQFKNESTFYAKKVEDLYENFSYDEGKAFKSKQMSKIAKIYGEMHPESNYSHVHVYYESFRNYCFLVHP